MDKGLIERYENRDLIPLCIRCRRVNHNGAWIEVVTEMEYGNYTGSLCEVCYDYAKEFNRNKRLGLIK